MKKYLILISCFTMSCLAILYQYEYRAEVDHFSIFTLEDSAVTLPKLFHTYSNRIDIIVPPRSGVLSNGFSTLIYTPHLNFTGKDTFQYKISRGIFGADMGTVQISVHPVNDEPVLKTPYQTMRVFSGESKVFTIAAVDPDDKRLRFNLKNHPIYGELKGSWPNFVYQSFPIEKDSIENLSFDIVDQMGARSSGTLEITILKNAREKIRTLEIAPYEKEKVCLKTIEPFIKEGALAVGDFYQYESSPNAFYKPASTIKILTAAVVKNALGSAYRFETNLFKDEKGGFYIQGSGDPNLRRRDYNHLVEEMIKGIQGEGKIKEVTLDLSLFKGRLNYNGRQQVTNYFEAPLSSLSIDRNTVNVVKRYGYIYMRNKMLPLTPYLKSKVKKMPDGRQFIPVAADSIGVGQFLKQMLNKQFEKKGFPDIRVQLGSIPKEIQPIYTFRGESSLEETVRYMLKYSNNFIANQLLLTAASTHNAHSVDLDDGVSLLSIYLKEKVQLDASQYILKEGAGLSSVNQISLLGMRKILKTYSGEIDDLAYLSESKFEDLRAIPSSRKIKAKTGSLRGVYNIVGYLKKAGIWVPFVIFLNQEENGRADVMSKIVECLDV